MKLYPYIAFNGNCEEAINLYTKALNGTLEIHRYNDDADMSSKVPADWQNKIMHVAFSCNNKLLFMACDITPGGNDQFSFLVVNETSPITLSLAFETETEQTEVFNNLVDGGKVTMPLQDTFWGARFGMLTDKFGIKWMLNCDKKPA